MDTLIQLLDVNYELYNYRIKNSDIIMEIGSKIKRPCCLYCGYPSDKTHSLNSWLYHRIRMCIWKRWKKPRTKLRNLKKLGIPEYFAKMAANSRKAYWFTSNTTTVKRALSKQRLINSGFYDLATAYQSVHVNY